MVKNAFDLHNDQLNLFDNERDWKTPDNIVKYLNNLPDYEEWKIPPLIHRDQISQSVIEEWIENTLKTEGPIKGSRLIEKIMNRISSDWDIVRDKVLSIIKEWRISGKIRWDLCTDDIDVTYNAYLRLNGTQILRVRKRGSRKFSEIQPDEVTELIESLLNFTYFSENQLKLVLSNFYDTTWNNESFNDLFSDAYSRIIVDQ